MLPTLESKGFLKWKSFDELIGTPLQLFVCKFKWDIR